MAVCLMAAAALLPGCSKELDELEAPVSGTETSGSTDETAGDVLRIQVSDAGFRDGKTGSRATDSGLKTTFDDGDKIGLFVVDSQNEMLYANVPYTKNGEEWTAAQNVRTKGYPVRVFAYYPYVKDAEITGKVDATAQDASAFFANYIEGLDISNQSTEELYRKADVMACMVKVADTDAARKELTLSMSHLLGQVVVKLPETVTLSVNYYLKEDEDFTWKVENVTLPANLSEESFTVSGIQPLEEETGYRYLCKSGDSNISFSGGFTTYEATKSYTVSSATVSAGSSKTYNVSVTPFDASGKAEYTPQVGDFYMSDGAILSRVSESNKNNCIGIVFWLGDPTATDPVLKAAYPKCTHGLVVSLKEAQNIRWQAKYESTAIQSWATRQSFYTSGGYKSLNYNVSSGYNNPGGEIQGYNNTEILKQYNNSHSGTYPVTVLSCFSTITSGVSLSGSRTSGWYLPSPRELVELSNWKTNVNTSLKALGSTTLSSSNYWSSGEDSFAGAWGVFLGDGLVGNYGKTSNYFVRLAFAF